VAGGQWGVIGETQLRGCGVTARAVARWRASGKLHLVFPRVYAYGHPSIPIEGRLVAALLYAGEGAVLSHRTAAWWWGLIDEPPRRIEASRPTRTRSLPEVLVRQRSRLATTRHRRFPITTIPQTLLDLAATEPLNTVRMALAQAEYDDRFDLQAIEAILGQGRPGSKRLRRALTRHQPALAATRSRTERILLELCERHGLEIPEVNKRVHGWTVDFLWRKQGLVVETDGDRNHHTPAQLDRDRRKDLALSSHGMTVSRYRRRQVEEDGDAVIADIVRTLEALEASRTALSA
jgi:very-short-patch-repair endonuclease